MDEGETGGFFQRHFKVLVFGIAVAALGLSVVMFLADQGIISAPRVQSNAAVTGDTGTGAGTTPSGDPIFSQQQAGSETGAPVIDAISGKQTGIKCPADYCLNPVQGSGSCPASTGQTGTYTEQECYDYPEQADNLAECDQQRRVYYKVCGVEQ